MLMYDLHCNYIRNQSRCPANMLSMDEDNNSQALVLFITSQSKVSTCFDFSNYPLGHPNHSILKKKVIGKMKDEKEGKKMKEFVGLYVGFLQAYVTPTLSSMLDHSTFIAVIK